MEAVVDVLCECQSSFLARACRQSSFRCSVVGLAAGLTVAVGASRLLRSMLFGVTPMDPATLGTVTAVLLAVGLIACYLPARRAMGVNPMVALRTE